MNLLSVIQPELILIVTACALFVVGAINRPIARRASAVVAFAALFVVFFSHIGQTNLEALHVSTDVYGAFRVHSFAIFVKAIAAAVGMLFVLMSWPANREGTANSGVRFDTEGSEYFALLLLSISGIFVVAGANDLVLLFLGIELASIPTYIMVSISRPVPAAQEAGVKYFFLGAMSAAVLLFGLSYLYGTTNLTSLSAMAEQFHATIVPRANDLADGHSTTVLNPWQMLAVVMVIAGFAFKMAAVPLHFYAGDVYEGAATPVTALLSFVPKTAGLVALVKILYVVGGSVWAVPSPVIKLIWIVAVLSMTVGNLLGLIQRNVKRMLAYSSIAHSGYMLVGVSALIATADPVVQHQALRGVLFYVTAYGMMNAAAFGVLMLLPAKPPPPWDRRGARGYSPDDSAETLDDLAGAGIRHPMLGIAMAIACFSLIGLPLTVGFFGKFYLIRPAWDAKLTWLVVLTMINAAISAGYYLRLVATMFLRPEAPMGMEPTEVAIPRGPMHHSLPVTAAVFLSAGATVCFGTILPATELLESRATTAASIDRPVGRDLSAPRASAAMDP